EALEPAALAGEPMLPANLRVALLAQRGGGAGVGEHDPRLQRVQPEGVEGVVEHQVLCLGAVAATPVIRTVELAFRLRVTVLVVAAVAPDCADHPVGFAQAHGAADPPLRLGLPMAVDPAFQLRSCRLAAATTPVPFGFLALPLGDGFGVVLMER